jgi:catechol 2,3-dioxygenase-like lactoylglutathione lyase family enzyme
MSVERMSFVLPVPDLAVAVSFWGGVLGIDPTFVDGDRWAQFDHGNVRLALAGTDQVSALPGAMLKVSDLEETCQRLAKDGYQVSDIATGAHERRAVAAGPGGWPIILYAPS